MSEAKVIFSTIVEVSPAHPGSSFAEVGGQEINIALLNNSLTGTYLIEMKLTRTLENVNDMLEVTNVSGADITGEGTWELTLSLDGAPQHDLMIEWGGDIWKDGQTLNLIHQGAL